MKAILLYAMGATAGFYSLMSPLNSFEYYKHQIVRLSGDEGIGTGFYVKVEDRTYILTNAHVCKLGKEGKITVQAFPNKKFTATILRFDEKPDLCLIDSKNNEGLSLATRTYCGESAYMSGFANGAEMIHGVPSKTCDHVFENYVVPGHSGSPVVNNENELIGVIHSRETCPSIGYMATLEEVKKFLGDK